MITEEIVNRVCIARGMKKMTISKIPTWIDSQMQEGLEYHQITKDIKPFWVVAGTRNYEEPTGVSILKTIELIKVENIEIEKPKEERKEEEPKEPEKQTDIIPESSNGNAELPEFFTDKLLEKWSKMKTMERIMLFQRTPKNQIFQKPVGSGQTASYVKGNYMVKEANACFLFDWKFIQQGISIGNEGVAVYGVLEANFDGKILSRPAVGYEEINKKMTAQLAIKSATTDAIKKGLSLFGFNSDVYSGEV